MKKAYPLLILGLLWAIFLTAAPVSEELALEIGQKWLQYSFPRAQRRLVERTVAVEKEDLVLYYIHSFEGGGWVLVAADDAALPILGYSETGRFEYPITSPAVRYWMNIYEQQIIEAIQLDLSNSETLPVWNEIRGGLFSRWDSTRDVTPPAPNHLGPGPVLQQLLPG